MLESSLTLRIIWFGAYGWVPSTIMNSGLVLALSEWTLNYLCEEVPCVLSLRRKV